MNEQNRIDDPGLITMAALAARGDFKLGEALVSPATRTVSGPGGRTGLEPRVMQVLIALVDQAGAVVSRDTLFQRCWGDVFVGDDSLNRTIASVRKVATTIAAGSFAVETVPRVGYQLVVNSGAAPATKEDAPSKPALANGLASRRSVVGGVVATAAVAAGLGYWAVQSREDREFAALVTRGEQALDSSDPGQNSIAYLQQAVAIRPRDARALGFLAYAKALRVEQGGPQALVEAEQVARAALAVDPGNANARLAKLINSSSMLEFADTEDGLRRILATAPDNMYVMRHLWSFLQCVGRSGASLAMIERAMAVKPYASGTHYPRAQLLWILGRNAEADRVITRAREYWPEHRFVRFAQFMILAFTGRARAALTMIEDPKTAPQHFSRESIALWRVSLAALDQRSQSSIADARQANLDAAKRNLQLAPQAVQTLSALGQIDPAFEIAKALFVVSDSQSAQRPPARSTAWRFAPWLFIPPLAPLRADPRFRLICDEIGLTDYWDKRGIGPDPFLFQA